MINLIVLCWMAVIILIQMSKIKVKKYTLKMLHNWRTVSCIMLQQSTLNKAAIVLMNCNKQGLFKTQKFTWPYDVTASCYRKCIIRLPECIKWQTLEPLQPIACKSSVAFCRLLTKYHKMLCNFIVPCPQTVNSEFHQSPIKTEGKHKNFVKFKKMI